MSLIYGIELIKIIRAGPSSPRKHFFFGTSSFENGCFYFKIGNYVQAIKDWEAGKNQFQIGLIYLKQGHYREAFEKMKNHSSQFYKKLIAIIIKKVGNDYSPLSVMTSMFNTETIM
jgi:hypothetical protein